MNLKDKEKDNYHNTSLKMKLKIRKKVIEDKLISLRKY